MKEGIADKYLKVSEAARILNVSRSTAYSLLDSGELPSVRFGGCRRVSLRALRDYEKRSAAQAADRTRTDGRATAFACWLRALSLDDATSQQAAKAELTRYSIEVRRGDGGLLKSSSRAFRRRRETAHRGFAAWLDAVDARDQVARRLAESSLGRCGIQVRKLAPTKARPSK